MFVHDPRVHWFGAFGACLLLGSWGCGDDSGSAGSATCAAVTASCYSDAGVPPELDPDCNSDLAEYRGNVFREPVAPAKLQHALPRTQGVEGVRNFAPRLNSGELAVTTWLTGDEPLTLDVEISLGSEEHDVATAYGALLLDGLVQTTIDFPLHPGDIVSHPLSLSGRKIPSGAHSANMIFWTAHGWPLTAASFDVLKDSVRFPERTPATAATLGDVLDGTGSDVRKPGASFDLSSDPDPVSADGSLELQVLLTPTSSGTCQQLSERMRLIAFLDNEQIALGELGLRPAFDLHQGQGVSFRVKLEHLPVDHAVLHTLQFWQLEDDSAYSEGPAGQYSAWWHQPRQVTHVSW